MKELFRPLTAIVCVALLLFAASHALRSTEERMTAEELQTMMETLLPGSTSFREEPYSGEDENIRTVFKGETGYVVETVTAGYAGDVTLWVGADAKGSVTGLTIRDLSETSGLGRRAASDIGFLSQFLGTSGGVSVGENIDALTGATVTSKAVTKGVNAAAGFVTGANVTTSATEWGADMRKGPFFLDSLLTAVVGLACVIQLLLRTFAPSVRLPHVSISVLLLLSLTVLALERYLAPGASRRWGLTVLMAALTFALLPWCSGAVDGSAVWKLGLAGGAVFGGAASLYDSVARRAVDGPCRKAAPAVWALLLYLAGQCLTWAV